MVQTYSTESLVPLPFHVLAPAYFLRYPNPYAQHVLSVDVIERSIVQRSVGNGAPTQPVLLTARILLKKGTLPSWAPKGLIKNAESWVLEVSEVDLEAGPVGTSSGNDRPLNPSSPFAGMFRRGWGDEPPAEQHDIPHGSRGRQMRTWTRNLDHTTVLAVAEGLTFTELSQQLSADSKGKGKAAGDAQSQTIAASPLHCLTSAHITSDVSVLWGRIEKFGLKRFKAHMETSRQGLLWSASTVSNQLYPHTAKPPIQTPLTRLRESLRPPWLDGLPLGPIQSLRHRTQLLRQRLSERYRLATEEGIWIGGQGRKTREESMERWRDAFRERLVRLRGSISGGLSEEQVEEEVADTLQPPLKESSEDVTLDHAKLLELPRERLARLAHQARESRQRQSAQSQWSWSWWPWSGS